MLMISARSDLGLSQLFARLLFENWVKNPKRIKKIFQSLTGKLDNAESHLKLCLGGLDLFEQMLSSIPLAQPATTGLTEGKENLPDSITLLTCIL